MDLFGLCRGKVLISIPIFAFIKLIIMKKQFLVLMLLLCYVAINAQDLRQGLLINDLEPRPMQLLAKPGYLQTVVDPSFGTTIRRITNVGSGGVAKPVYSTIQAWNTDETLMFLYERGRGHFLLDGRTYEFIRYLDDVRPDDLENIFWHFSDPNIFFYIDDSTNDLIRYYVNTQTKDIITNLKDRTGCAGNVSCGNDVQMMSWDSDVIGFRCGNTACYSYRISTDEITQFNVPDVGYTAPEPGPSGNLFFHQGSIYDASGNFVRALNVQAGSEHSCNGMLSTGEDAYFAISFGLAGVENGCLADVSAHNMNTGVCFPLTGADNGYDYPKSGTHMSALAYKNPEKGWLCASMMGYEQDGQVLLDQELIIARADEGNVEVCRIAHHRADEDDPYDYWGEPHASISPTGTRVIFASDWSGAEDGQSVETYVVELPSYSYTNVENTVSVEIKAMLSGAVANADAMMSDDLRAANLIPTTEPYLDLDYFNHTGSGGGEQIDVALLNATDENAIVDWVMIELRDANNPTNRIETKSALLRRDGSIVDKDGSPSLEFPVADGNYHIAIRHRNHLGVMTQDAVALSSANTLVDFSNGSTTTYGSNAQKQLESGMMGMWSGDANADEQIVFQGIGNDSNDVFFTVLNDPSNPNNNATMIINGYMTEDVDLSGETIFQGINNDVNKIFFDILAHPGNTSLSLNYIISQQIP